MLQLEKMHEYKCKNGSKPSFSHIDIMSSGTPIALYGSVDKIPVIWNLDGRAKLLTADYDLVLNFDIKDKLKECIDNYKIEVKLDDLCKRVEELESFLTLEK